MPKISVIVPVYNVEPYIHRCIDSILHQSFSDFELILVDDGSPDNCGHICDEYAQKDARVHVIHQKNGGLSAARNAGIDWAFANSDSQWITFIDSDDWIDRHYLEYLSKGAELFSVDVVMGNFCYPTAYPHHIPAPVSTTPVLISSETMYCNNYLISVSSCSKLFRKSLFEVLRYPVGVLHEDMFITYKLLFHQKDIAFVDAPVYCYFQSENSITRSEWNPKKAIVVYAHKEAVRFFEKQNFPIARETELEAYLKSLANSIWALKALNHSEYRRTIRRFVRLLRVSIIQSIFKKSKRAKAISIQNTPFIYDVAFPLFMKLRSYFLTAWRKIIS